MEFSAKTRTEQILIVMYILAWVAFIGYNIQAGVFLITYGVGLVNPGAATDLYQGLNLYELMQYNFWHYTLSVSFLAAIPMMKAYVSFLAIKALSVVNLVNPFTTAVAERLEKISYVMLGTWVVAMLSNAHTSWLLKKTGELQGDWISGDSIFAAGIVFIMAQVFKRGVEIQSENDLTV